MENKKYQLAFVIGRFQTFHKGHASLVELCKEKANRVIVLVGSSQKSRLEDNPFTFEERKEMIKKVFPDVDVISLIDIGAGNVPAWGEYMLGEIDKHLHMLPDLFISGNEDKVDTWFSDERLKHMDVLKVDRGYIPISGTQLRSLLIEDKKDEWFKYMPSQLIEDYDKLRKILLSIE